MNAARLSEGLLRAAQTMKLLQHLEGCVDGIPTGQLLRDVSTLLQTSRPKILNTVEILSQLQVLKPNFVADKHVMALNVSTDDLFRELRRRTAQAFADRITSAQRESCIGVSRESNDLQLDSLILPGVGDGFRLWLIEFDIVVRPRTQSRFWTIQADVAAHFLKCASTRNDERHSKSVALTTLKASLERNEALGREAEDWVLSLEKRKLMSHVLVDQIRRISDEDVTAGFDIVSFSGLENLTYDRFIEVKSYSDHPHFFWSRNEIAKAKELAESYVLILVDRKRMEEPSYVASEIPNPYRALFLTDENGWEFEPNSFEFNKISGGSLN